MNLKIFKKIITIEDIELALDELKIKFPNRFTSVLAEAKNRSKENLCSDTVYLYREHMRDMISYLEIGHSSRVYFDRRDVLQNNSEHIAKNTLVFLPGELTGSISDKYSVSNDNTLFLRVNNKDSSKISCFLNLKMAKADRRTELKPGKIFRNVLGYTDNEQIKSLVTLYEESVAPVPIKIAYSKSEIIRVYENGPTSCMMNKGWEARNHPAIVYEHDNLCVAYIENKRGNISARTVLRTDTDNPEYIRIYGDSTKMDMALKELRIYKTKNGFVGIHFPMQYNSDGREEHRVIMPYLDGDNRRIYIDPQINEDVFICGDRPHRTPAIEYSTAESTSGFVKNPKLRECYISGGMYIKRDMFAVHFSDTRVCFIHKTNMVSNLHQFEELVRAQEKSELWDANAITRYGANINGIWYSKSDRKALGIVSVRDKWFFIIDPAITKCAYTDEFYLKEEMLFIKGKYYDTLPRSIQEKVYFNKNTANVVQNKKGDMKSLLDVRRELVSIFAAPVHKTEVQSVYPTISDQNARLLIG